MRGDPGIDFPETKAVVDVICSGNAGISWVEDVTSDELVITAPRDRRRRRIDVETGERLNLIWTGLEELRALPVEVVAVETSGERRWRLRATGPAGRGQRRAAVRAPMTVAVRIATGTRHLDGVTVDLSEGGMRCVMDAAPAEAADAGQAPGAQPTAEATTVAGGQRSADLTVGDVVQVVVSGWEEEPLETQAEVVRRHRRQDELTELSIRFIGLSEYQEDRIRRQVFAHLRDMRQRGLL